jgi:hypothetical protein
MIVPPILDIRAMHGKVSCTDLLAHARDFIIAPFLPHSKKIYPRIAQMGTDKQKNISANLANLRE